MKWNLRKKSIRCLLFLSILLASVTHAQNIPLPKECRFHLGDQMDWANPSFNDSGWDTKPLGKSWSATGMKENIYAWYRIKIVIPSGLKTAIAGGMGIKLNLGKIDDVDQTFFNGKLIGQTGSLPPHYQSKWDSERIYMVPENDLLWDQENVIAVRVFSLDPGGVGMYQGDYHYGPVQWSDYISIAHSITQTDHNGFTTKIKCTNKSNNGFNGTATYWISDKANRKLFSESRPVIVKPAAGSETVIVFSDYKPSSEHIFNVGYQITGDHDSAIVKNEQVYLADKNITIQVAGEPKPVVENKVPDLFVAAPFQDQQLLGYIGKRMSQNLEERLLKVDEPGIINGYLQRPGNHPWIGEHVGKYLEAACNVWKNTHDTSLKKQMDRMMYELINTQLDNGYLGTYTPDQYWTSWDVWSHKYNLYGLLAYYTTTGYQPALEACKRMGDLLCTTFGNNPGQRDIISAGEHVGMAATSVLDPMVELYRYTGEKKYLDFCYYILDAWEHPNGPGIISTLLTTGSVHKVANGKAYEMLSNLVGLMKLYRVTGDGRFLSPVLIAWRDIVTHRLYITGTTSSFERFQDDAVLPGEVNDDIGEGCVTVTWIQLNLNLLAVSGELKYVDQIEKSVYNHLLGAENPETGCVSYYTPLMGKKPYSCDITCCTSSVPRGIAMIPYCTFGNIKNTPTLMLYEPAVYRDRFSTGKNNINLLLQIESDFPEHGGAVITVKINQTARFPISLRVPSWCSSFTAAVGGTVYKGKANEYLYLERTWKPGEKIMVSFKMPVQIITGGSSYPGQIAFQKGPQVLALDDSLNKELLKTYPPGLGRIIWAEKPSGKNHSGLLPKQWIGDQAYIANINEKENKKSGLSLILVPYADASQTGGSVKVWLPLVLSGR